MSDSKDIKSLNDLIETTLDSAFGYYEAAKDSSRYAPMFQSRADERRAVATNLQAQVRSLGGDPEDDGTLAGAAHRMFVNLRNVISSGDTAVVDEVERGEDHIKEKYEKALQDPDLTPATRSVIQQAYTSVRQGHDQMRDLKHALHAQD